MITVLVTLDQYQVDIADVFQQIRKIRLRLIHQLFNMRPATRRRDDDLIRTGFAVLMTIFARVIYIEIVVRMFDRRHTIAAGGQLTKQGDNQCSFPRVFKSGDAENSH